MIDECNGVSCILSDAIGCGIELMVGGIGVLDVLTGHGVHGAQWVSGAGRREVDHDSLDARRSDGGKQLRFVRSFG